MRLAVGFLGSTPRLMTLPMTLVTTWSSLAVSKAATYDRFVVDRLSRPRIQRYRPAQ